MNILVVLKMVPDIVEELEIAPDGRSLDPLSLRMVINERDEHALEEALLLKERCGGTVTALALETPEIDDVLYTALAKGADRAVKVSGVETGLTGRAGAGLLASVLADVPHLLPADLILTGVEAIDDLDGQVAPFLAHRLGLPYIGIVTQVTADTPGAAMVIREYAGGLRGEFEVSLPAVVGIQAATKPPRYVPVAKVRAAMKSRTIESVQAGAEAGPGLIQVLQMAKPEAAGRAEMLEGSPEEIADGICVLLAGRGLL
ncbi:MAG: electron transfer flavoprotein subunit beta/FixA family protein [Armatimonadetes bacterium]|nr:electron transfer flavoprotein subunit beta/FixA family protein [Armatimonadota bacterium]